MHRLIECRGFSPKIAKNVFIAPNVNIIGDVEIAEQCSIWFNVTIRGDVFPIRIGRETNIQDGTVIHGTYQKCGTTIGQRVSVGHGVILHGCEIGDEVLIGMGSIIMDKSKIPSHSVVGAGSLVTEESTFESGWLILGRPAKAVRRLTDDELKFLGKSADNYKLYQTWYNPTSWET